MTPNPRLRRLLRGEGQRGDSSTIAGKVDDYGLITDVIESLPKTGGRVRVALDGYEYMGRILHRTLLQWHEDDAQIVAINTDGLSDLTDLMYRLKYDSIYGLLPFEISAQPSHATAKSGILGHIVVNGHEIAVYENGDSPGRIWADHKIDVVIDTTHRRHASNFSRPHLDAGAKAVVVAEASERLSTYVIAVNDESYAKERVVSTGGPSVNCLAPLAQILNVGVGIDKAIATVIVGYTIDQRLRRKEKLDYRDSREIENIVPLPDASIRAAAEHIPVLKHFLGGGIVRVPALVGLMCECTFFLNQETSLSEIESLLATEADNSTYKGVVRMTSDPIVSADVIGDSHSCIVDSSNMRMESGSVLRISAWQDNIYGYANRVVETTIMIGSKMRTDA